MKKEGQFIGEEHGAWIIKDGKMSHWHNSKEDFNDKATVFDVWTWAYTVRGESMKKEGWKIAWANALYIPAYNLMTIKEAGGKVVVCGNRVYIPNYGGGAWNSLTPLKTKEKASGNEAVDCKMGDGDIWTV